MTVVAWLLVIGVGGGLAFWAWRIHQGVVERRQAAAERYASFVASAYLPQGPKADPVALAQQMLLFEAAAKAAEANEPVLCIQLYARLLSRYPDTRHAAQARAAVEAQKKKLAAPKAPPSPRGPGPAAPG